MSFPTSNAKFTQKSNVLLSLINILEDSSLYFYRDKDTASRPSLKERLNARSWEMRSVESPLMTVPSESASAGESSFYPDHTYSREASML